VVDRRLRHHGVVLELRLPQRRGVGSDEDQLSLAGAKGFEGAAIAEDDLAGLDHKGELRKLLVSSGAQGYPCWLAVRTLAPMDWASFLFFLGAIATVLLNDFEE
jgi:hypothetical protein